MQRPTFCSASQQLSQFKQNNQEKREERNYSTTDPVHGKLSPPVGPNPSACSLFHEENQARPPSLLRAKSAVVRRETKGKGGRKVANLLMLVHCSFWPSFHVPQTFRFAEAQVFQSAVI